MIIIVATCSCFTAEGVVEDEIEERVYHITIPGTFVQVSHSLMWVHMYNCHSVQAVLPGSAPVFKEGFIMKKNIMEAPHKKGEWCTAD